MKSIITKMHSFQGLSKPLAGKPISEEIKPLFRSIQLGLSLFSTIDNYPPYMSNFDLGTAYDPDSGKQYKQANLKVYHHKQFQQFRKLKKFSNNLIQDEFVNTTNIGYAQSEGKSGLLFFFSKTTRFFLKQLKNSELKIMDQISVDYCQHVGKESFIVPYYAIFTISFENENYHFTIMDNAFLGDVIEKYDLKGSVKGRTSGKSESTLKDNNLKQSFHLKEFRYQFGNILEQDVVKLIQWGLLDYSMLIGVFNGSIEDYQVDSVKHIQTSETEYISFAIIDILTVYTKRKTFERFFKQFQGDLRLISAQKPEIYGERFQRKMLRVFIK